jgi:hypothetical protein
MLEHGGALWTWSLAALPAGWAERLDIVDGTSSETVPATRLAEHRLAYLEYEGPISGDRGEVRRAAAGEFAWKTCETGRIEFRFASGTLSGQASLVLEALSMWRLCPL